MKSRHGETPGSGINSLFGLGVAAGIGGGVADGVHYYRHHTGDWRIGLTAVGIALAIAATVAAAAFLARALLGPQRRTAEQGESPGWGIDFLLWRAVAAGIGGGLSAGIRYYQHHSGDWHIDLRAVAIGIGIAAATGFGAAVARSLLWPHRQTTNLVDLVAAGGSITAGIYLLQYQDLGDSSSGTSWFQIIGHGIGIYFLAKGVFMLRAGALQASARNRLER